MGRLAIFGLSLFSLIFSCLSSVPTYAGSLSRPSKAELSAAVSKIETFADYPQYYGANSTTPIPTNHPYYQEYEYLHSLAVKTNLLITRYDDIDFANHNLEAYNLAITVIDQAIESCRYLFGIVRSESLATQPTSPNTTPTPAPNPAPNPTTRPTTSSSYPNTNLVNNTTTTTKDPKQNTSSENTSDPITTFHATETSNLDNNQNQDQTNIEAPIEVPKTGDSSKHSSLIFISLVSLSAAFAATAIYYIYNRQPKHSSPASRRRRH